MKSMFSGLRIDWVTVELGMLALLILSKYWLLLTVGDIAVGYDAEGHIAYVNAIWILAPYLELQEFYYAHHPFIAFWLPAVLMRTGLSAILSVQIISVIASLISFFCVRKTLQLLNLLESPQGIAFLYIAFGMPIQVYMSVMVGMDVLMTMWACIILLLSVRMFWAENPKSERVNAMLLLLAIVASLLTKYSGLLLCVIPVLVILFSTRQNKIHSLMRVMLICFAAGAFVLPYYYERYFKADGTINFGTYIWTDEIKMWKSVFHGRPLRFIRHLFLPFGRFDPWFQSTWESVWGMAEKPPFSFASGYIRLMYAELAPLYMLLGSLVWAWRRKALSVQWHRLGGVLAVLFCILLVSLAMYIYRYPLHGYFNNKGIYIAPASFIIAFLLSHIVLLPDILLPHHKTAHHWIQLYFITFIAGFVLINHLVPIF
jgi:hypothetical protein